MHSRQDSLDGGSARRNAATYTQNKRTQIFMPWVGFEPMIPAFEWAKTVHALDRAATVIDQKTALTSKKTQIYQLLVFTEIVTISSETCFSNKLRGEMLCYLTLNEAVHVGTTSL
jgi:hypothetical protein